MQTWERYDEVAARTVSSIRLDGLADFDGAGLTSFSGGDEEVFRIGVMESLTGSGETYGTVANQAKQMAADEINAAGGVNGRRLRRGRTCG